MTDIVDFITDNLLFPVAVIVLIFMLYLNGKPEHINKSDNDQELPPLTQSDLNWLIGTGAEKDWTK